MKKITIASIVFLGMAGAAVAANNIENAPRPPMKGKHGKMHEHHAHSHLPRGFEKLNLSDEQKAKIKAIVEANKPEAKAKKDPANFKQKMEARRQAEQKLMSGKQFDEAAARQMIVERQQERMGMEREFAERELQMLKKRHAIFQVLTPAQQKQFQEEQQKQLEHFMNRKNSK